MFQQVVTEFLKGVLNDTTSIDDILIYADMSMELKKQTEAVSETLRQARAKLNQQKYAYNQTREISAAS